MIIHVSAHDVVTVTKRQVNAIHGGSRWTEFKFIDVNGNDILEVTAFHTDPEETLEHIELEDA